MKALALDPELADAHAALAQVYSDHDWNWEAAEREYRRALEINPNSEVAHGQFAQLQLFRHRFDDALEHSRRAVEIDPFSPFWAVGRGTVLENTGRHEEAIAHWQTMLRSHSGHIPALLHLSLTYINAGRPAEAVEAAERAIAIRPNSQLAALKAAALAKAGRREEALALVAELEEFGKRKPPPSHSLALAWTILGDRDKAFHWLERAYRDRLYLLRWVAVAPGFEPLRGDPRYADLMRRMGL